MTPLRPSILNRRLTKPSIKNTQNEDKEFKNQLKISYKKQELYKAKEEQIRKIVSPNRDDSFRQQQDTKLEMQEQLILRSKNNLNAKKEEQIQANYKHYCNKYCGPHNLDATTTQIIEKKKYLKHIMEQNKQSEREKKQQNHEEKKLEIEADHIRAITPCSWNRRHYV